MAAVVLGATVAAHAENVVSQGEIIEGGWTFQSIIESGKDGSPVSTKAVVAWIPQSELVGENITAVLFLPSDADPSGWETKSWASTDRASIAKDLMWTFGLSEGEVSRFPVSSSAVKSAAVAPLPQKLRKGVLEEDVLFSTVQSVQSDMLVQTLKDSGYPVAILPFDKFEGSAPCQKAWVLQGVAAGLLSIERNQDAVIAMQEARVGIESICDAIIRWSIDTQDRLCRTVIKGKWGPSDTIPEGQSGYSCGPVEPKEETRTITHTNGSGAITGTTTVYTTCFVQTCTRLDQREVRVKDRCGNKDDIVYTETCTGTYEKRCCMSGQRAFGPDGNPPCAMKWTLTPDRQRWSKHDCE
jgi:hypothetical protein